MINNYVTLRSLSLIGWITMEKFIDKIVQRGTRNVSSCRSLTSTVAAVALALYGRKITKPDLS
jgi:hypothetical protein